MDATTTKKTGFFGKVTSAVKGACKDAVPSSVGGKVVAGTATAVVAVGSFFLGRATKKAKK